MIQSGQRIAKQACSCCGNSLSFHSIGARSAWHYFRCGECGGVQLSPVPSEADLEHFYNFEYVVEATGHIRQMNTVGKRMLSLLEAKTAGRRLLEIGCSYGGFLRLAQCQGWSCVGIEASHRAANEARKQGLEVYSGNLESNLSSVGSRKFDVIALWHVIEHLPDARQLLCSLSPLLAEGGYLAIRTPNAESLGARLLGRRWEWFYAPEHVFLYSANGIRQLLEEFKLQIESLSTQRGDAQTLISQSVTAVGSLVVGILRRSVSSGSTRRRSGSRLHALHRRIRFIGDFVGRPIDRLLGLNGDNLQGSELVVLARKA